METTIMENQMEKNMENEMETRSYSLNFLKGGYIGDDIAVYYRGY